MKPDLHSISFRAEISMDGEEISASVEAFSDRRAGIQLTSDDAETIRRIILKAAIPMLRFKIGEAQAYADEQAARRRQQIDALSDVIAARGQDVQP